MSMRHQCLRYRPRYSSSSHSFIISDMCFLFALKQMQVVDFSCCSLVASQERKHHHD